MKSREEVARLLITLAGALCGVAVGLGLLMLLFQLLPKLSESTGLGPLLIIIALCGGGLVGGGWLGLWFISRRQQKARRTYFDEKKKRKKRKR